MTYTGFLLLFLLLPLVILIGFLRERLFNKRYLAITGALALVALIYMAPWDHVAAMWGFWSWENSLTWGIRWWVIPPEEYIFCILEALLAITLTFALLTRNDGPGKIRTSKSSGKHHSDNTNVALPPENTTPNITIVHAPPLPTCNQRAGRENEI